MKCNVGSLALCGRGERVRLWERGRGQVVGCPRLSAAGPCKPAHNTPSKPVSWGSARLCLSGNRGWLSACWACIEQSHGWGPTCLGMPTLGTRRADAVCLSFGLRLAEELPWAPSHASFGHPAPSAVDCYDLTGGHLPP